MSTAPAAVVSQDPAAQPDWRAGLPEELRSEKSLESFKDIPSLAKSFVETKKSMGNAIRIPKADAKPEEWDTYYTKTGRPESPDKYELKRPTLPEGVNYDEDMEKWTRTLAHKIGANPQQAQGLLEGANEYVVQRMQAIAPQMEESQGKLKSEWGSNYDKNLLASKQSISEYIKEAKADTFNAFLDSGVGNHPELAKYAAYNANKQAMASAKIAELETKIRELTGEDRTVIGDDAGNSDTAESIKLKINEIQSDPKHPYNDVRAPYEAREAAKRHVGGLFKQLYPPTEAA